MPSGFGDEEEKDRNRRRGGKTWGRGAAANTFLDILIVLGGPDVKIVDHVWPMARGEPKASD